MSRTEVDTWHHARIFTSVEDFMNLLAQRYDLVDVDEGTSVDISIVVDSGDVLITITRMVEKKTK